MPVQRKLLDLHRSWKRRAAHTPAVLELSDFGPSPDDLNRFPFVGTADIAELDKLRGNRCLFLLGRPGAGKTAEFQYHFQPENFPGETLVRFEVRELDSSRAAGIFEDPDWRAARESNRPVRLVLDGVDEALFREPNFFDIFKRRAASERALGEFSLVLTCRLAEWDDAAAAEIATLWQSNLADCAFELLPLSAISAMKLAVEHGVQNREAFLQACGRHKMTTYACWPRTLIWLAREFASAGNISSSLTELHQSRCQRLFEDDADEAVPRDIRVHLSPDRAVLWNDAIELIATVGLATGTQRFRYDGKASDICEGELNVREISAALARLPPQLQAGPLAGNPMAFTEALRIGVFENVRGARVFQEQSDMEFLAAHRLRRLPVEQLIEFFGRWQGDKWRVVPQFATTAATLAGFNEEPCRAFRRHLLFHDPLVLLRTDFARVSYSEREEIVEALIEDTDREGAEERAESQAQFATLRHPNLAKQLGQWLWRRTASRAARSLALHIGIEAECFELAEDVWELATAGERFPLSLLPYAVEVLCYSWPKERFLRLARHEAPCDPTWSIAGNALRALFSHRCPLEKRATLEEVVPILEPNATGVISAYDMFLRDAANHLRTGEPTEIVAVLRRLANWPAALDSLSGVCELAKATLKAAIALLPRADIADALALGWIAGIRNDDFRMPGQDFGESLSEAGLADATRRQALLEAILRQPGMAQLDDRDVHWFPSQAQDLPWLLDRLNNATGDNARLTANLVCRWIRDRELRQRNLSRVEAAYVASEALRKLLPKADLDGIHATLCRLEDMERERQVRESAKWRQLHLRTERQPRYDEGKALRTALDTFATGKTNIWPVIVFQLSEPGPSGHGTRLWDVSMVEELPAWEKQPEEIRAAIRSAARAYILNHKPEVPPAQQMTIEFYSVALALTLWLEQLKSDTELRAAFSSVWVEAILGSLHPTREPLPELLAVLHGIDPDSTLKACLADLERTWSLNYSFSAAHLDGIWSPLLRDGVASLLGKSPIRPHAYESGLSWLAGRDRVFAASLALDRLREHAATPASESRRTTIAVCLFLFPEHWQSAWPLLVADPAEGARLILGVVNGYHWHLWKGGFQSQARQFPEFLAELHTWMLQHDPKMPTHEDTNERIARRVNSVGQPSSTTVDEEISTDAIDSGRRDFHNWHDLRNVCLKALQDLGQFELLQMSYKRAGVADEDWARSTLRQSVRVADARAWRPWALDDFLRFLVTDGGTRVIDNDSLLRAVVASLGRFERSWKDMPTQFLWNAARTKPLQEEQFRDTLLRHLREDLPRRLLLSREPQFFTSERGDIEVKTVLPTGDVISIMIEVKQCGHREAETAIETQLAERYLIAKGRTHGLYVVGWFSGDRWPKTKRTRFQNRGIENARAELNKKARDLSNQGLCVAAVVLDCRIPGPATRKQRSKSKAVAIPA